MLWYSVALWFIECCEVPMINMIYCPVINHLMHQWIVYHLDHLFSFCCLWYPFILKTDGLEFSSDNGSCSGSTFAAGPSWLNGQLVEKFCASKEIRASSCLHVLCSWKILWTVKQQCIKLGSYGKQGLRVQRLVGTPTWPVVAFPYSSTLTLSALCSLHWTKQQTALALKWKWPFPCKLNTQEMDGHFPDHAYKVCQQANSRTGRPAGAQNKSRPLQETSSIHCSLSEGSTHRTAHQERATSFDCTAVLPDIQRCNNAAQTRHTARHCHAA